MSQKGAQVKNTIEKLYATYANEKVSIYKNKNQKLLKLLHIKNGDCKLGNLTDHIESVGSLYTVFSRNRKMRHTQCLNENANNNDDLKFHLERNVAKMSFTLATQLSVAVSKAAAAGLVLWPMLLSHTSSHCPVKAMTAPNDSNSSNRLCPGAACLTVRPVPAPRSLSRLPTAVQICDRSSTTRAVHSSILDIPAPPLHSSRICAPTSHHRFENVRYTTPTVVSICSSRNRRHSRHIEVDCSSSPSQLRTVELPPKRGDDTGPSLYSISSSRSHVTTSITMEHLSPGLNLPQRSILKASSSLKTCGLPPRISFASGQELVSIFEYSSNESSSPSTSADNSITASLSSNSASTLLNDNNHPSAPPSSPSSISFSDSLVSSYQCLTNMSHIPLHF